MTTRHRQAAGSTAEVVSADRSAFGPPRAALPARWEDWFRDASSAQRAAALALAEQQGLVYLHQLPALAPGSGPRPRLDPTPAAEALARLLSGKPTDLPPFDPPALDWFDADLDDVQRAAAARALATPDVCLLQGLPGTGKSRVLAEVVRQAGRSGWRVLLLAPRPAALDVVLRRVAGRPEVFALRYLDPDETAETLPEELRALTLPEQQRAFRASALDGARQARERAEEDCRRRSRENALWPELRQLAERLTSLRERQHALRQSGEQVPGEVEREAAGLPSAAKGLPSGPFAVALREMLQTFGAHLAEVEAAQKNRHEKRTTSEKELQQVAAAVAELEPKYQARQQGRWWTLTYWTAGSAVAEMQALHARKESIEAELRDADRELTELAARRAELEAQRQGGRLALVRGEMERRQQELSQQQAALEHEAAELRRQWDERAASLEESLRPAEANVAAVEDARRRWQEQAGRDEDECQFARQWADYLEGAGEQLLPRLPALANLLAGTTTALSQDGEFARAASHFDLLIIEEAERCTESELLKLAPLAARLVLVAGALDEAPPAATEAGKPPRSLSGLQPLAPACWPKLWQALGGDLGRLPYAWSREAGRLVCQLTPLRPDDARHLECERLADAPDIELRILSRPKQKPCLAQVTFPESFGISEAIAFLFREHEELPIQPLGRTAWWRETSAAWNCHLGPTCPEPLDYVTLDDGVRLGRLTGEEACSARSACLEFAKEAGWDRERARAWLERHLGWRDAGRTAFLQVPYRMRAELSCVVRELLFPAEALDRAAEEPSEAAFAFVPVPAPRKPEWPREGAGLELDLAAGRHADRLPAEFRADLPRQGFVNFLEAQAVVRQLEQWAQAPDAIAGAAVLVLALYEGQAELLRRLVAGSDRLRASPFPLEIGVPDAARQRESDVVVVSLTRSHAHRCVPFGESPDDFVLALTRARRRLVVFGDPGALLKRAHWQGPLDHLDARSAHREATNLARLVRRLQEAGSPLAANHSS